MTYDELERFKVEADRWIAAVTTNGSMSGAASHGIREIIAKVALQAAVPPEDSLRDAERWQFLPLVHPMDICTVAMGAPTPQEFRRGMERAVDKLIEMAKQSKPQEER